VLHLVLTYFGALIWLTASSALPLRGAELCLDRPPKSAGEQDGMVEFGERKARSAPSVNYRIAGGIDIGEAKTKNNASPRGGA
jgi:hypothetical protein